MSKYSSFKQRNVGSSHLQSYSYDPFTQTLTVVFNDDSVYKYFSVPQDVYQGLVDAPSHGIYFGQRIRLSYRYEKQ